MASPAIVVDDTGQPCSAYKHVGRTTMRKLRRVSPYYKELMKSADGRLPDTQRSPFPPLPFSSPFPFPPPFLMASLTFSSLNVNGLRNPTKRFSLNRFLSSFKVHVVGLQETHWSTKVEARQWSKDFPSYDIYWSLGSSKQNGVSILIGRQIFAGVSSACR